LALKFENEARKEEIEFLKKDSFFLGGGELKKHFKKITSTILEEKVILLVVAYDWW
jgi:hypothetical protein